MLEIKYYEEETKKLEDKNCCCAYIHTTDFDGYVNLDQIETRCGTYEEAKQELLNHVIKLRDSLNEFIEKEKERPIELSESVEKGWTITYFPWEEIPCRERVLRRFKTTEEKDEYLNYVYGENSPLLDEEKCSVGVYNDYNYRLKI